MLEDELFCAAVDELESEELEEELEELGEELLELLSISAPITAI